MLSCTLNEIRAVSPCEDGWRKLLGRLGKGRADDTVVSLVTVLDSNGLDDALWVLDNVIKNRRIISLFAADCAERVLPLFEREHPDDDRPRRAIAVARNPDATSGDMAAAEAAAEARLAAAEAAWAGLAAAGDAGAADWAAEAAAGAAAGDAGAADWAAGAAAWDGEATAWDAERASQKERFRQYCKHGEAAADMPWHDMEESE